MQRKRKCGRRMRMRPATVVEAAFALEIAAIAAAVCACLRLFLDVGKFDAVLQAVKDRCTCSAFHFAANNHLQSPSAAPRSSMGTSKPV